MDGSIGLGHAMLWTTREIAGERQPQVSMGGFGLPRTRDSMAGRNSSPSCNALAAWFRQRSILN